MRTYQADLHIHTKLSPCGAWDMTPGGIVDRACEEGLDLIAICDHNTAGNVGVIEEAAGKRNIVVIAGIEITTAESIHIVGLFPDASFAGKAADQILQTLPIADAQYAERFGEQVFLDSDGKPLGNEPRALAKATTYTLEETVALIHAHGGLAIAAHIERPSFSVYSQLGDVPRQIPFDALEVSPLAARFIGIREKFARYGFPMIGSSDSHYLHEIGRSRTFMDARAATFEELASALRGEEGRSVRYA